MISNSHIPGRPSRRIVLLSTLKRTTMGLGWVTQRFFRKGEELEATGFETVPHDDPTLVPPKVPFRSFDKIPRNRAPVVAAIVSVAVVALGVFGWRSTHEIPGGSTHVAASVRGKASSDWNRLKAFVGHPAAGRPEGARDRSPDVTSTSESRPSR